MNTRGKYINRFRSLFLLLALLATGGVVGWGQTESVDPSSNFDGYNGTDTPYEITNKSESVTPVPVYEETIYVSKGESRELFIREIIENKVGLAEPDLFWYVQWYLEDDGVDFGQVISMAEDVGGRPEALPAIDYPDPDNPKDQGDIYEQQMESAFPTDPTVLQIMSDELGRSALRKAKINGKDGLFWSRQIFNEYLACRNWMSKFAFFSRNSAHVMATLPEGESEVTVICDVSYNNDYEYDGFEQPSINNHCDRLPINFTAPTLAKRYKFHIRPAEENLITDKEDDFKHYTIYAPKNHEEGGINLQLPMSLDNYYWYGSNGAVERVKFEPDWGEDKAEFDKTFLEGKGFTIDCSSNVEKITLNKSYRVFTLKFSNNTISEETTFTVKHAGILLAEYTIIPVEEAGFTAAVKIEGEEGFDTNEYHRPEDHPNIYEEIGVVDFDSFDGLEDLMGVKEVNKEEMVFLKTENALEVPISTDLTSYSFAYPSLKADGRQMPTIFSTKFTPQKNMYALYRTALRKGATETNMENSLLKEWYSSLSKTQKNKIYEWYCGAIKDDLTSGMEDGNGNIQIFDRTYVRHLRAKGESRETDKYGFFLYVDAAEEPGKIITVPIDGTVCGQTELLITAWINNMTTQADDKTRPNLNIHLVGVKGEEEKVLQRITTGYTLEKLKQDSFAPHYIGRWQQFHCVATVSDAIAREYSNFRVEIYNNAPNSDGNDFAIDDIRIYRKRLTASAQQTNSFCEDANQFNIRLDYDELKSVFALDPEIDIPDELRPNDENHDKLLTKLKNSDAYQSDQEASYRKLQYYVFGIDNAWREELKKWAEGKSAKVKEEVAKIATKDQNLVKKTEKEGALYLNMELVRKIQALEPAGNPLSNCFRYAKLYYYNDEGYQTTPSQFGYCVISNNTGLMHKDNSTKDVLAAYDEDKKEIVIQDVRLPANTPARDYYLLYIPSERATEGLSGGANSIDDCGIYVPFQLKKAADLVDVVEEGGISIDNIEDVQANKTYTLTGHFSAKENENSELEEVKDATFDWFFGSYDDFMNPEKGIKDYKNEMISLQEALSEYHGNETGLESHNQNYLDKIKEILGEGSVIEVQEGSSEEPINVDLETVKLVLHAKKIQIKTPQDFTNKLLVVTPNPNGQYTDENSPLYCINPRELALGGKTSIVPGDPEVLAYPTITRWVSA